MERRMEDVGRIGSESDVDGGNQGSVGTFPAAGTAPRDDQALMKIFKELMNAQSDKIE